MFRNLTFLILILFASVCAFAQEKDTVIVEDEDGVKDTIIIESEDWEDDWEENWDRDWDEMDWTFDFDDYDSKPAISINYGFSKMNRDDLSSSFADPALIEARLGYSGERPEWEEDIVKYSYKYFRVSYISTELSNKNFSSSELESGLWRFSFGREGGYGWKFGESAVLPYNSFVLDWSRLEMKRFPVGPFLQLFSMPDDVEILEKYHESFRFGTSSEAGIKFKLIAGVTLEAAYERSIIFERHLFWKWAGSAVIEIASQGLLDSFINEVMDASPYAAPIVSFVLKNALSYGIYELRQEKMNWPFSSAPPLAYDQFKFGLTFMF